VNEADSIVVNPATRLNGRLRVPGDKSISHRVAMIASLADGPSRIEGFLCSEDCLNTLRAVETLGAVVCRNGTTVSVDGTSGHYAATQRPLDMGNSGTGMRLLAGLLAGHPFTTELTGDASLCSRPMRRIQEPLERMGAEVELKGAGGCAPMRVHGRSLEAIDYNLPVASAQVKSCVLLAGLYGDGVTTVVEPRPTRDHTERMLSAAGAEIHVDGARISLAGCGAGAPQLRPCSFTVPGDFSSAAFWLAAAACRPDAQVSVLGLGLNPRRTAFLDVLRRMGTAIECSTAKVENGAAGAGAEWEPVGDVAVTGGELRGTVIEGDEIPNLIDELPLVAVVGALAEGKTLIRDAAELRVKESDRIATVAAGLRGFGVHVDVFDDGLCVTGPARIRGGCRVNSHGDHRIAMALAVLSLFADAPVAIDGVACIATSYPGFFSDLESLQV